MQTQSTQQSVKTDGLKQNNGGSLTQGFQDNRPEAITLQKMQQSSYINQQSQPIAQLKSKIELHTNADQPMQFMRAGVIPKNPDAYRTTTRIVDNNSYAAIDGPKSFNDSQKTRVRTDNSVRSNDPFITAESRPLQDDFDNTGLLPQDRATVITPEVDHIVPQDKNGANDIRNARVLSKSNNNNANNRPDQANSDVAVYENFQTADGTNYNPGDVLSDVHTAGLIAHYGRSSKEGLVQSLGDL